jgi:hypothetical protein
MSFGRRDAAARLREAKEASTLLILEKVTKKIKYPGLVELSTEVRP